MGNRKRANCDALQLEVAQRPASRGPYEVYCVNLVPPFTYNILLLTPYVTLWPWPLISWPIDTFVLYRLWLETVVR